MIAAESRFGPVNHALIAESRFGPSDHASIAESPFGPGNHAWIAEFRFGPGDHALIAKSRFGLGGLLEPKTCININVDVHLRAQTGSNHVLAGFVGSKRAST